MRIIPKNTRAETDFFKGIKLPDVLVVFLGASIIAFIFMSDIAGKPLIIIAVALIFYFLMLRIDSNKAYIFVLAFLKHLAYRKKFIKYQNPAVLVYVKENGRTNGQKPKKIDRVRAKKDFSQFDIPITKKEKRRRSGEWIKKKREYDIRGVIAFTKIEDGLLHFGKEYSAAVLEIKPLEFQYLSESKQDSLIDKVFGTVLREVSVHQGAQLVKIDRPVDFSHFIDNESERINQIKESYLNGLISEEELTARAGVLFDRRDGLTYRNTQDKAYKSFYYIVFFDTNQKLLKERADSARTTLANGGVLCNALDDKELAVFMRYQYTRDFDERELDSIEREAWNDWILPDSIELKPGTVLINDIVTHNIRVSEYPDNVLNAWCVNLFDIPDTKVVMKLRPVEKQTALRRIARAIGALRGRQGTAAKENRPDETGRRIEELKGILALLQKDSEVLFEVNTYITVYEYPKDELSVSGAPLKRSVKRMLLEESLNTEDMFLQQFEAFVGSSISALDMELPKSSNIHSSSVAAAFPFASAVPEDEGGINLGFSQGVPAFLDFFKRDDVRKNSNMAFIGKPGPDFTYAAKTMLLNLSAEDTKVFVLDPENEYPGIADKISGKVIDAGSSNQGRLNPFHVVSGIDAEDLDSGSVNGSFDAHLKFLEDFFRLLLPEANPDELEQLSGVIIRMYKSKGIGRDSDLARLAAKDFPTFNDLQNEMSSELKTAKGDNLKSSLRALLTYISRFAEGGRDAELWNGSTSFTADEAFVVFNFQSLYDGKDHPAANARLLLVLKWLDNEIIKNRNYNLDYEASRKIIIVLNAAHKFIDEKYPDMLNYMLRLSEHISKYNGMQIIIIQNTNAFAVNEYVTRKATDIISACQYSFIFPLPTSDIRALCELYKKSGGFNELEREHIINNPQDTAFVISGTENRSCIRVVASPEVSSLI